MSSHESTYTGAVFVVILVFSLLNYSVVGKSLMLGFLDEEWPNFQSTDRDGTNQMEEKLIKRDHSGHSHLSNPMKPLIRLLRLQKLDNTTDDVSKNVHPRVRFGKRSTILNFTGDSSFLN